jgi:hypothetical protein
MSHPKEFHSSAPKHGHEHMYEILDGHHEKSVKHDGAAISGPGGLAPANKKAGKEDTRAEVFKSGGKVRKHK